MKIAIHFEDNDTILNMLEKILMHDNFSPWIPNFLQGDSNGVIHLKIFIFCAYPFKNFLFFENFLSPF